MSWICHRCPNFSPIFPDFPRFSTSLPRQTLHKRPHMCSTHGTHVLVPTPRSRIPPSITGLMRHHPAPITCLHSRPRSWTLGPRPLSIVPTISTRFRLVPISYHLSKFSHWATYTIALLLLSPHCFSVDPHPVLIVSFYVSSIVLIKSLCSPFGQWLSRSTIVLLSI